MNGMQELTAEVRNLREENQRLQQQIAQLVLSQNQTNQLVAQLNQTIVTLAASMGTFAQTQNPQTQARVPYEAQENEFSKMFR